MAIISTVLAVCLRILIDPLLGNQLPFVTFFIAVTVTAYFANTGATLLAIVLGYVSASWFFIEPRHAFFHSASNSLNLVTGIIYVVVSGCIGSMSYLMAQSRSRALEGAAELVNRQRRLETEISEREKAQEALLMQSRFASELLHVSDKDQLFELLAERVHSVAEGALVSVSEFEPNADRIRVVCLECQPRERAIIEAVLGRSPVGLSLVLTPDMRHAWTAGLALLAGGLDELLLGQIPYEACERLGHELGIGDVYAVACSYQEDILGTVAVMTHGRGPLSNQRLIESLVAQAGLAIKRIRSEQARNAAEERLRLAQDLSLDAFTILDAVRDSAGTIVDFRWLYVNPVAGKLLKHDPGFLVGQRLLEVLPGNRESSELFERYVRVVESGKPHDFEIHYRSEGIDGWFRNMAVRVGDGLAVSFSDISARVQAEAVTARANEALRESDRRKDDFLAMLSHELRNPLAAMSSALQVLERAEPRSRVALRAQAVIARQMGQLTRLVEDLLEITRITRKRIQLQPREVELNGLVERTLDDCRLELEQGGVALEFQPAELPAWIDADPARLVQVLGNLMHNAAKFTGEGGRVTVSVTVEPTTYRALVRVADTGAGIAPELLSRVFEPFMQADISLSRSKGGLGLGLALVKELVELHGGEVSAKSAGLGQGSEFTIDLPLSASSRDPARLSSMPPRYHQHRRVLVVDDNPDAADSLRDLLCLEGHEVEVAYRGREALDKARHFHPEVLLCDIGLPEMDGYAVARAFRNDPELESVFLTALSGYSFPQDLERSREAGFQRHISKPASLQALHELLDSIDQLRAPSTSGR